MGTPDYMPPEQAQGKQADFRSDIYSLARRVLRDLHRQAAVPGREPDGGRGGPHPAAAAQAAQRQPEAVPELEALILKGLAKDPAKRWQTTDELLEALSAVSTKAEAAA